MKTTHRWTPQDPCPADHGQHSGGGAGAGPVARSRFSAATASSGERTVQPGGHLRQCGQPAEAQPQGGEGRPRRGRPRAAHRGHRCRAALRVGWRAARAGRQRSTDLSHGGSWRR